MTSFNPFISTLVTPSWETRLTCVCVHYVLLRYHLKNTHKKPESAEGDATNGLTANSARGGSFTCPDQPDVAGSGREQSWTEVGPPARPRFLDPSCDLSGSKGTLEPPLGAPRFTSPAFILFEDGCRLHTFIIPQNKPTFVTGGGGGTHTLRRGSSESRSLDV